MKQDPSLGWSSERPGATPFASALRNSLRGFAHAARFERAVRQELMAIMIGVPAAMVVSDDLLIRLILVGVLLLVIAIELLNTALEKLCDHVTPTRHPEIGTVKDLGSAAVFCTLSLAALVWIIAIMHALCS